MPNDSSPRAHPTAKADRNFAICRRLIENPRVRYEDLALEFDVTRQNIHMIVKRFMHRTPGGETWKKKRAIVPPRDWSGG
jgi:hypothetical protein